MRNRKAVQAVSLLLAVIGIGCLILSLTGRISGNWPMCGAFGAFFAVQVMNLLADPNIGNDRNRVAGGMFALAAAACYLVFCISLLYHRDFTTSVIYAGAGTCLLCLAAIARRKTFPVRSVNNQNEDV